MSITAPQLARYHADGFLVVPSLLNAEETDLLGRIARADSQLRETAAVRSDGEGGQVSLKVRNELPDDDIHAAIARSRRIVSVVEQLLDGEVYHYHHKLIFKDARTGGAWAWHQDYGYWYDAACLYPLLVSCLIAIDAATRDNGCLQVIPGSHHLGRIDHGPVGDQTGADAERVEIIRERLDEVAIELDPGDAIFFHCNLLHCSAANTSPDPRWALICSYNAARNDPYRESRHPRYTPLDVWADEAVLKIGRQQWSAISASSMQERGEATM